MCNSLAFQTPVHTFQLLEFETYDVVDPLGVFPLFLKMVEDFVAPALSIICNVSSVLDRFQCVGNINVTRIPNGASSPDYDKQNNRSHINNPHFGQAM